MTKLEDIKGLKIAPFSRRSRSSFSTRSAPNAVPAPYTELYTALETGTVDGQENPSANIINAKFYEVAEVHDAHPSSVQSADRARQQEFWDGLNDEEKAVLQQAAVEARDFQRKVSREQDAAALEEIRKTGMEVSELSPEETQKLRDAVKPMIGSSVPISPGDGRGALQGNRAPPAASDRHAGPPATDDRRAVAAAENRNNRSQRMTETLVRSLKAGLIGAGIQASLTPAMHMAEGAAQGIRYDYELIDLNVLGASERICRACSPTPSGGGLPGSISPIPASRRSFLISTSSPPRHGNSAPSTRGPQKRTALRPQYGLVGFCEGFRRGLPDADSPALCSSAPAEQASPRPMPRSRSACSGWSWFDREAGRAQALARMLSLSFRKAEVADGTTSPRKWKCRRPYPRDADRHGEISRIAARRGASFAKPLGRRDRLFFAGNGASRGGPAAWRKTLDGGGMAGVPAVGAFRLFTGLEPDAARMLGHFRADDRLKAPVTQRFI